MKNIYKFGLMVASVAFIQTAAAKGPNVSWCGYNDHFHTTSSAPANLQIRHISGDSKVVVVQNTPTTFTISDGAGCPVGGGYVQVRYAIDSANGCDLTIHDAEDMWDPNVVASCQGSVHYNGISYDGLGTYTYSLVFGS